MTFIQLFNYDQFKFCLLLFVFVINQHQICSLLTWSLIENAPIYNKIKIYFSSSGHPSKLITAINVIALDDQMETIYSSLQRSLVNVVTVIIIINQH